jgi:hypothetical protein
VSCASTPSIYFLTDILKFKGGGTGALQLAVVPPFEPAHDHVQGPVPATAEGAPTLQSHEEGVEATLVPLVGPQTPFTGAAV